VPEPDHQAAEHDPGERHTVRGRVPHAGRHSLALGTAPSLEKRSAALAVWKGSGRHRLAAGMLDILVGLGTSDSGSPLHQVPHMDREDEPLCSSRLPSSAISLTSYFFTDRRPIKPKRVRIIGNPEQYTSLPIDARSTEKRFGLLGTRNNTPRAMINSKGRLAVPQCYSQ
jgi:hypothetical protein